MNCPKCGAWSRVLRTTDTTFRRRECANGHRFTTQEVAIADRKPGRKKQNAA